MFIDADDVLACGAIDALLRNHCDIVQGGYYEFAEGYREDIVVNRTTGFAWGKVFRAELCFREMNALGLIPSKRMYNLFLRQCIMNYGRCRYCPRKVQKAVFVLECELMRKYFENYSTDEKDLHYIEEALIKKCFNGFEIEIRVS